MIRNDASPCPAPVVLTVEEFAGRLQVSRATVFTWMKKNILVPGRHYFKLGRVLRFVWGEDLIHNLLEDSRKSFSALKPPAVSRHRKEDPINWDY